VKEYFIDMLSMLISFNFALASSFHYSVVENILWQRKCA